MSNIRYVRQKDEYSCGVIAIINIMKWGGEKISARVHRKKLIKACKCTRDSGVWEWDLSNVLFELKKIVVDHIAVGASIKLKDINKHIDHGGAIIIKYVSEYGGHYTVCVKRNKRGYFLINDSKEKTISFKSKKTLKNMLGQEVSCLGAFFCATVWFINKKG